MKLRHAGDLEDDFKFENNTNRVGSITHLLKTGQLSPKRGKIRPKSAPSNRKSYDILCINPDENSNRMSKTKINKIIRNSGKNGNDLLHETAAFTKKMVVSFRIVKYRNMNKCQYIHACKIEYCFVNILCVYSYIIRIP